MQRNNVEIEKHYLVDDADGKRKLLVDAGMKLVSSEYQSNYYLTHPFFPQLIADKVYFRVRDTLDGGEISISSPFMVDGKEVRKQFSIKVDEDELDERVTFIEALGFEASLILEKTRECYAMDSSMGSDGNVKEMEVHVELDTEIRFRTGGSKTRLEDTLQLAIESPSQDVDLDRLDSRFNEMARKLDLREEQRLPGNYFDRYFKITGKE